MASYVLKKKGLFTTYVRTALVSRHVFTQNGTTPLPNAEYLIHLPGKKNGSLNMFGGTISGLTIRVFKA